MSERLRTTGLSIGYGGAPLLSGLDLVMNDGMLVALIGANGTGKSTLLRTLAGSRTPLAGCVMCGHLDVHRCDPLERSRRMAVVLTGRPRIGTLDVATVVGLGRLPWTGRFGALKERDHRMVMEAMERCGVSALRSRAVGSLSDGECQQVMIARALAQDAPLLLLDEPTSHLDLANRVRIMRSLRSISRSGPRAVLLSTHDVQLALDLCDRLLLVRHDRSHWQGTPMDAKDGGVLSAEFDDAHVRFDPRAGVFRAV